MLPLPQIVNGHHLGQPVPVARNGKGHGVVLVFLAQRSGGQHEDFVGHGGFRNVQLAAFHDDAVLGSLLDADVRPGVGLIGGTQQAVALGVRLGAASDKVPGLEAGQPFLEILVVIRLARLYLVRFKRYVVDGVGAVNAHAPLNAAADFLAEHPGHVLLAVQVNRALVNVREAVDLLPGQVRRGGKQVRVFRLLRFFIGCPDRIEAIHLQFVGSVN